MSRPRLLVLVLVVVAAPVWSQDPPPPAQLPSAQPPPAVAPQEPAAPEQAATPESEHVHQHSHDHSPSDQAKKDDVGSGEHTSHDESSSSPPPTDGSEADASVTDPAHMDHSQRNQPHLDQTHMGHGAMGHDASSPPAAGDEANAHVGPIERTPATAPVAPFFDSAEMNRARNAARQEMGGGRFLMLQGDRLEWRSGEGDPVGLFEGQGWYGGDANRLWVKTEIESLLDAPRGVEALEEAEVQALYSRPISPYFDLQAGVRHDFEPGPSRTYAVVGVQGLAPQWFEVDLALFLSEDGDLSSRLEAEYEMLFTQRLGLQFRAELDLSAEDVPELGIGSGLSTAEAGLRLSYGRIVAPYVGVEWVEKLGRTADLARGAGEEAGSTSAVFGLRFWY